MKIVRLKYPYVAVMKDGSLSYGGNQSWFPGNGIKKYGCGVIAGTDVLLYLSLHKEYCRGQEFREEDNNGICEEERYQELVRSMHRRYFPVIPGFGMPGWFLSAGMNHYFRRNRIPLKASFGVLGRNIWIRTAAMLAHDIPVILAIGPNLSLRRRKHKLNFYVKQGDAYVCACQAAAHFVTATAMEGGYLKISSWGREYYIDMQEYMDYVKKHSCFWICNVFYIRKR